MSDDEFEFMQARARSFRRRVADLGGVSGSVTKENVRQRLRLRTTPETLTRAQYVFADEIVAFLKDARLSRHQAASLEREFFRQVAERARDEAPSAAGRGGTRRARGS